MRPPTAELGLIGSYGWSGRTIEYHRAQIGAERGFREATVDDEQQLAGWLARELCPVELDDTRLREDLLARFRAQRIEPPARSRLERIVNSGRAQFERQFTTGTVAPLPAAAIERLEQLAARDEAATASAGVLAELKSDPGRSSLNTVLEEIDKLERGVALGLPSGLFADCSEKLIAAWRARAATAYPSDLRAMPQPIRLTAARGAVLVADRGDHRLARRSADRLSCRRAGGSAWSWRPDGRSGPSIAPRKCSAC